jgi:NTP pyrophosphatase (non-canonical NTP hydrolase)
MLTGIVGEVIELVAAHNSENALEELGDIEFYVEGFRQGLDISRSDVLIISVNEGSTDIVQTAGELLDQTKKYIIYNKELDINAVFKELKNLELCLERFRTNWGFSYQETLNHNIRKLGSRYKGHTYSDAAAQTRADKV